MVTTPISRIMTEMTIETIGRLMKKFAIALSSLVCSERCYLLLKP